MGQTGGGSIYEQEISKVCDRRNSKLISSDTFMRNEMKHEGARTHAGNFASYLGGWHIFYAKKRTQFMCVRGLSGERFISCGFVQIRSSLQVGQILCHFLFDSKAEWREKIEPIFIL